MILSYAELRDQLKESGHSRLVVVGPPGGGKSTLAKPLARDLGLTYLSGDDFFWRDPACQAPLSGGSRREVLRSVVTQATAGREGWVFEGHFKSCHDVLLPRAQAVVRLDVGLWSSYRRYLLREWNDKNQGAGRRWRKILFVLGQGARIEWVKRRALAGFGGPIYRVSLGCGEPGEK